MLFGDKVGRTLVSQALHAKSGVYTYQAGIRREPLAKLMCVRDRQTTIISSPTVRERASRIFGTSMAGNETRQKKKSY